MGRPPKPLEQKRLTGRTPGTDSGGRKLPELATVLPLPAAPVGGPPMPEDLGLEGRALWARMWADGLTWISPLSDLSAVIEACFLADDLATARRRYRATTDPSDGRVVVAMSKRMSEALSALGFDPAARTRLGVAEVKRVSALEQLAANRRAR